jgi:hypothetical protein
MNRTNVDVCGDFTSVDPAQVLLFLAEIACRRVSVNVFKRQSSGKLLKQREQPLAEIGKRRCRFLQMGLIQYVERLLRV